MKKVKKIITAVLSVTLAATMVGCTPTIGAGTSTAMTIDKYDVPAGLFIYYTMQGYSEASGILEDQRGSAPELKDVKNATIDSVDSTDWIQNKATDYCLDYVTIIKEFDDMGGELSQEDIDSAESMASYYYAQDKSRLDDNGVSLDTMEKMAQMTYKERAVFKHYYGYDGSEGCTEEELKDYFDDNFARIKYVSISLTDSEGNALTEDEQRERRKMAEKYAEQVNKKTDVLDKMHELDKVQEDYDEYIAQQTTTAEGETTVTTTTTTTTTAETETTTTTDPYANERLFQKVTTTTADDSQSESDSDTTTTSAEEADTDKDSRLFSDFVFNKLEMNKAEVYDYNDETIYVVLRADLRERMTEDDYWSEDYQESILEMRYYDTFVDMLDEKSKQLTVSKNSKAYRRYEPFKLVLEDETTEQQY